MQQREPNQHSQRAYTQLMKEWSHTSTAQAINYEDLSLLLFMTQTAISDLKLLKSLFFHRKFSGGLKFMKKNEAVSTDAFQGNNQDYANSQSYWDSLNSDLRDAIKTLPVNPVKLDRTLRTMISNAHKEEQNPNDVVLDNNQ